MGQQLIFALWIAAPVLFIFFALYATLERMAKNKASKPGDYLAQSAFLAGCGVVAYLIHRFVLDALISVLPFDLPRNLYLLILWPALLWLGAKLIGPSRDIMIERAPEVSHRKR